MPLLANPVRTTTYNKFPTMIKCFKIIRYNWNSSIKPKKLNNNDEKNLHVMFKNSSLKF